MVSPRGEARWLAGWGRARAGAALRVLLSGVHRPQDAPWHHGVHPRHWTRRAAATLVAMAMLAVTPALATAAPAPPRRQVAARVDAAAVTHLRVTIGATPRSEPGPAATPGATVPAPATPLASAPAPAPSGASRLLPVGKGMWLHQLTMAGNDPDAVVARARAVGLTHVYLRLGSSKSGFYDQDELNRLLPAAHAAGLKVVGWDFPYLDDPAGDARRARDEIQYTTPSGDRIDAFSADVETQTEGVNVSPQTAGEYATSVRQLAGPGYPLIATVPRAPHPGYPYAQLAGPFDAVAPMVYWMGSDPAATVAEAVDALAPLGKPVMPVGQAYDGSIDHGPAGAPPASALEAFMGTASAHGAIGVSFWVWHLATPEEWGAIGAWHEFDLGPMVAGPNDPRRVAFLQRVLGALGVPTPVDGRFGESTRAALAALQQRLGIRPTGELDVPTLAVLK